MTRSTGTRIIGATRFDLFGEVLLVGAVVLVLAAPVVTAVPALAVGVRHLRRYLDGEADSARRVACDVGPAVRDLWQVGVLTTVALALLAVNVWVAGAAGLPGARLVAAVSVAVAGAVVVVALGVAGDWEPGQRWGQAVRASARRARLDLTGSLLLVAAVVMSVVIVWMLTPLVLIVGGLLAFAVVAVTRRRTADQNRATR